MTPKAVPVTNSLSPLVGEYSRCHLCFDFVYILHPVIQELQGNQPHTMREISLGEILTGVHVNYIHYF